MTMGTQAMIGDLTTDKCGISMLDATTMSADVRQKQNALFNKKMVSTADGG